MYHFFIRAHIHQMICNCNWLINFETRRQRAVTCPRPARQKGNGSRKKRRRFVHSYPGWWFHTSHILKITWIDRYVTCVYTLWMLEMRLEISWKRLHPVEVVMYRPFRRQHWYHRRNARKRKPRIRPLWNARPFSHAILNHSLDFGVHPSW